MDAPKKKPPLQRLERLTPPPRGRLSTKWHALGAGGLLFVFGIFLLVMVHRSHAPAAPTRSLSLTISRDAGPQPITGSRARVKPASAQHPHRSRPRASSAPAAPVRTADGMLLYKGVVTSGVPLILTLRRAGVSARNGLAMLKSLGKLFDPRRARPGHRFELHVDPSTRMPVYLSYQVGPDRLFEVRRAGAGFDARRKKIAIQRRLVRLGGTVGTSLGAELAARGAHPALLGRVLDVLTSMPKFFRAQRFGDTFRILIEEELVAGRHLRFGPVLALEYRGSRSGTLRLYHFKWGKEPGEYYNDRGVSLPKARLHIPVHYTRVSSPFGIRFHPVLKRKKLHAGTDFVAPAGTPVRATLPGRVLSASRRGAYGNLVVLDHGRGLLSYYAHLLRFRRGLERGQRVRARQVIGYVGSTGRSTGPHLHFGLKLAGKWIDPLAYRLAPGRPPPKGAGRLRRTIAQRRRLLDKTLVLGPFRLPLRVPSKDQVVTGVED